MRSYKMYDGYKVIVDGESIDMRDKTWSEVMDFLHMPEMYRETLFREFAIYGEIDLSNMWADHEVIIELIPTRRKKK